MIENTNGTMSLIDSKNLYYALLLLLYSRVGFLSLTCYDSTYNLYLLYFQTLISIQINNYKTIFDSYIIDTVYTLLLLVNIYFMKRTYY